MSVQVIEKNGQIEWAVVPYDEYQKMLDAIEMLDDIRLYDEGVKAIEAGEELIPSEVVYALLDGVNPVQVWREYRGLTTEDVCKAIGITPSALAQIESGNQPVPDILAHLAQVLGVDLDDLIEVNTTE